MLPPIEMPKMPIAKDLSVTIGKDIKLGSFLRLSGGANGQRPTACCFDSAGCVKNYQKIESYPAPVDMVNIPLCTGFYASQVMGCATGVSLKGTTFEVGSICKLLPCLDLNSDTELWHLIRPCVFVGGLKSLDQIKHK